MLTKRETNVLSVIVEIYVETALPVGSAAIATRGNLGLSSASLRAVMAKLTEKGFLHQPHTSAGRVPSTLAFRYYVDQILRLSPLSRREQSRLQEDIIPGAAELPQLLRRSVQALSSLTNQVCVVMAPRQGMARWRQIDFVLLRPGMVMAVLVMHGGIVSNRLLHPAENLTGDELVHFGNYLNSMFEGRTIGEVRAEILRQVKSASKTLDILYRRALDLAEQTVREDEEPEVFVGGTSHLAEHPEFSDLDTIQDLLRLIEERTRLLELLDKTSSGRSISVSLGQDTGLQACSLVASSYAAHATSGGTLAVLGPVRMNYARILPMVDFAAQILSQCLKSRF